jgi:hypothetical protein
MISLTFFYLGNRTYFLDKISGMIIKNLQHGTLRQNKATVIHYLIQIIAIIIPECMKQIFLGLLYKKQDYSFYVFMVL